MRTILIRLAEILGLCFILSPVSCALYYYAVIPTTNTAYGIMLFFATVIFIAANVVFLRNCYFDLRNPALYYIFNYIAYGIFIAITVVCHELLDPVPYSWLFNTLKLMAFSEIDLSALAATLFTHAIMLVAIALAPIGMSWIFDIPDEEFFDIGEEYIENSEDQINNPN